MRLCLSRRFQSGFVIGDTIRKKRKKNSENRILRRRHLIKHSTRVRQDRSSSPQKSRAAVIEVIFGFLVDWRRLFAFFVFFFGSRFRMPRARSVPLYSARTTRASDDAIRAVDKSLPCGACGRESAHDRCAILKRPPGSVARINKVNSLSAENLFYVWRVYGGQRKSCRYVG